MKSMAVILNHQLQVESVIGKKKSLLSQEQELCLSFKLSSLFPHSEAIFCQFSFRKLAAFTLE